MDPQVDPGRETLTRAMDQHRKRLRLEWTDIASRAGMSPQNLLRIRNGEIKTLSDKAKEGIEQAFNWPEGAVDAILAGGDAPPLGSRPSPGDVRFDDDLVDTFVTRLRSRILSMSADQLVTLMDLFPDVPAAEKYELLRRITRLKTQRKQADTQSNERRKSS